MADILIVLILAAFGFGTVALLLIVEETGRPENVPEGDSGDWQDEDARIEALWRSLSSDGGATTWATAAGWLKR